MTPEHTCPHLPIECRRLRLRDFRRGDLDTFATYRANPDIARYQGWDDFSREDALEFFAVLLPLRFAVARSWYQIAIAGLESDEMLGDCAIHFTGDEPRVEIGFTLAPDAHGEGYAFEAVSALIDLVFNTLDKQSIFAITHAHNAAANRLLKRLGFDRRKHNSGNREPELLHTLNRKCQDSRSNPA